jgi:hypothetical protein
MLAVAAPFVSMAISGKPGPEVGEPFGGGEEVDVAYMVISGKPGLEVGEPPGGGEEVDVAYMAISGEPGPEVGDPPPTWPPFFTSSSTSQVKLILSP